MSNVDVGPRELPKYPKCFNISVQTHGLSRSGGEISRNVWGILGSRGCEEVILGSTSSMPRLCQLEPQFPSELAGYYDSLI